MKLNHNLIIDIIATVIYLIAANPIITGLAIHEWISLGLILVFVVHCATHYDWIVNMVRHRASAAAIANLVLDVLTLIVFMVVTVSGLLVSRHILPLFGFVAPGYFFWNPIHSIAAKILLALLLIHVVVHWKWFVSLFKQRNNKEDLQGTLETEALNAGEMDQ